MSAEFVFSGGAGLWSRQKLVLGEEVLWCGMSGERQLSEILLYQGVWYESKSAGAPCVFRDSSCIILLLVLSKWFLILFRQEGKILFDQELYNSFSINSSRPYFITFAGDVSAHILYMHVLLRVFVHVSVRICFVLLYFTSADVRYVPWPQTDKAGVNVKLKLALFALFTFMCSYYCVWFHPPKKS